MALNIKDAETDRLVRKLAAHTGESITDAVRIAVQERLERMVGPQDQEARFRAIMEIAERASKRPVYDTRTPDEIIGYDEHGAPS